MHVYVRHSPMIAHKEAVLWGDEGLTYEFQRCTHIQRICLMHNHPWILLKRGVFARSFAHWHEMSSLLHPPCIAPFMGCSALPAYPSRGSTPSCCSMPTWSRFVQCSTSLPSAMRKMCVSVHVTCLPVGGIPITSRWWVPHARKRATTVSPW